LQGTLRLSTSVDHAVHSAAPALARFAELHPDLRIELRTSDRIVDLVAEGIDIAIRIGWLRDSSLHAVKLGVFEQVLVASPDYLRRRGVPRHPRDLAQHDWIALSLLRAPLTWKLASRNGTEISVHVKSRMHVDSPGALRALLQSGAGISVLDKPSASDPIRGGQLVPLLQGWRLQGGGIYAVYPPGPRVSARSRAFTEFYRSYLAGTGSRAPTTT
jgi:DNA-binding transcriptional LysR family regulator